MSPEQYQNWFQGSSFLSLNGDTLFVSVPDLETRSWLEGEYSGLVHAAVEELGLPVNRIVYQPEAARGLDMPDPESSSNSLNPKFTFGTFVGAPATSSHTRPPGPWPPTPPAVTIPSSSTADPAWARPTSCTPSAAS